MRRLHSVLKIFRGGHEASNASMGEGSRRNGSLSQTPPPLHHLHCSDVEGSTRTRVDLETREKRVLDKVPHIPLMMQIDKILNPLTFQNILWQRTHNSIRYILSHNSIANVTSCFQQRPLLTSGAVWRILSRNDLLRILVRGTKAIQHKNERTLSLALRRETHQTK